MQTFSCPHTHNFYHNMSWQPQLGRPHCARGGWGKIAFGDQCRTSLSTTSAGQHKPTMALRTSPHGPYVKADGEPRRSSARRDVRYRRHSQRRVQCFNTEGVGHESLQGFVVATKTLTGIIVMGQCQQWQGTPPTNSATITNNNTDSTNNKHQHQQQQRQTTANNRTSPQTDTLSTPMPAARAAWAASLSEHFSSTQATETTMCEWR